MSATRRMRSRLTRRMSGQRTPAAAGRTVLEPLFAVHRALHPKADLKVLQHAYEVAENAHRGQFRKSGDPYITHPLAVATILADLGMDTTTLVAALLHDTVEDTEYKLDDVRNDFSEEVAHLVDGVTKLDKVHFGDAAEAETIRKMIIAMAQDPRVLVIKLADRLHNMRTMRFLAPDKQARKAKETLEVLAPLAHRLGMATVKWELEDLAFAILHSKRYDEIVRLVADRAPSRDTYLAAVTEELDAELSAAKIPAEVVGRGKHYYSIYQKMQVRGREFDEIHDLVAVRILVGTVRECYAVMGVVHAMWAPMPGRFKDYIAQPRYGVYQSLHTTVIGPQGKPLEVQIRTYEMHHTAEYGIASHWRYKETKGTHTGAGASVDEMAWMRQLLDWQREAGDAGEFLDNLRYEIASNDIFVFTPKGDIHTLPAGSTAVDFAYSVHTEVGNRCIGAKVDGRLVALERTLSNGQIVEIFTSKAAGAGPSRDWLSFVVSSRAKTKIRQHFAKERREEAVDLGKEAITKAARREGLPVQRLISHDALAAAGHDLGFKDIAALYAAVGENHVSAKTVVYKVVSILGGAEEAGDAIAERSVPSVARRPRPTADVGVLVKGLVRYPGETGHGAARPVPGDNILGFITKGGAVSVHRVDCTNADALRAESARLVDVDLGSEFGFGIPGDRSGRGARPGQAAVGYHQDAGGRKGQHPVGKSVHVQGQNGDLAILLRNGRPEAPRPPAPRRARGRRACTTCTGSPAPDPAQRSSRRLLRGRRTTDPVRGIGLSLLAGAAALRPGDDGAGGGGLRPPSERRWPEAPRRRRGVAAGGGDGVGGDA